MSEEDVDAEEHAEGFIACNVCTWVWHLDCLRPVITLPHRARDCLFACSADCVDETGEKIKVQCKKKRGRKRTRSQR
jgi:hypothetical protein